MSHDKLQRLPPEQPTDSYRAFIRLDDAIKSALNDAGEENDSMYAKFFFWSLEAVNELQRDVFNNITNLEIPIEPTRTKTGLRWCHLPDDYTQYLFVGFRNQCSERVALSYNPNMVGDFEVDECHCECGCSDDLCEDICGQNITNESTTVTLATPVRTCNYAITFGFLVTRLAGGCAVPVFPMTFTSISIGGSRATVEIVCNNGTEITNTLTAYSDNIPRTLSWTWTDSGGNHACTRGYISTNAAYPLNLVSYVKNGVTVAVGTTITNEAGVDAFYDSIGWTKTGRLTYESSSSTDTWGGFNINYFGADYSIFSSESSCTVTTTDVDYVNVCKTCVNASGDIIKECCIYAADYSVSSCVYSIVLLGGDVFSFPLTDGIINVNGVDVAVPTINSIVELEDYLIDGYSFSITDNGTLTMNVVSSDVFTTLSSVEQDITLTFTKGACQTYEIVQNCVTERICKVTTKECGCIEVNEDTVNTLTQCGCFTGMMQNRLLKRCEWFVTLKAPMTCFGYYNVDLYKKKIYFNAEYPRNEVLLSYYTLNQVDSENYLIPVNAKRTVQNYIVWRYLESRRKSTPQYQIIRAEQQYYNEKRKFREVFNPIILEETVDLYRGTGVRP